MAVRSTPNLSARVPAAAAVESARFLEDLLSRQRFAATDADHTDCLRLFRCRCDSP